MAVLSRSFPSKKRYVPKLNKLGYYFTSERQIQREWDGTHSIDVITFELTFVEQQKHERGMNQFEPQLSSVFLADKNSMK